MREITRTASRLAGRCVLGECSVQMRKLLVVTSLLLLAHSALLFPRRSAKAEGKATSPVRIGIVLDVGGRGDKSFNDGAYAGADSATKMLGSDIRFIEPGEGADREAGLRLLAAEGMNLVIGVGFIFTDRSEEHTSELQSLAYLVCRLLLEKK